MDKLIKIVKWKFKNIFLVSFVTITLAYLQKYKIISMHSKYNPKPMDISSHWDVVFLWSLAIFFYISYEWSKIDKEK